MFAIVESGTQQFTVKQGDKIKVNFLDMEDGAKVELPVLLYADHEGKTIDIGKPYLEGKKVEAKVLGQGKTDKVRVFKMIRRHRRRVNKGHRQMYTELEITSIK
jgi:large subunit ribosomal protein L21